MWLGDRDKQIFTAEMKSGFTDASLVFLILLCFLLLPFLSLLYSHL